MGAYKHINVYKWWFSNSQKLGKVPSPHDTYAQGIYCDIYHNKKEGFVTIKTHHNMPDSNIMLSKINPRDKSTYYVIPFPQNLRK